MDKILKLLFFGDFVANEPENITLSSDMQELIDSSDFSVCNFEAVIKGENEALLKSGPSIQQSSYSPKFLSTIGIDMVSMANNHAFDYGEVGLRNTISSLGEIIPIGVGYFSDAYKVKIVVINGVRLGFFALTQLESGALTNECTDNEFGCAWINHNNVNQAIENIKSEIDYLFILSHAGVEDIDTPLPEWRTRYKELIDFGADAIIASHPHVPQGWEVYNSKPIFYSLGNFCFDSTENSKYWNIGLAVQIFIPINDLNRSLFFDVKCTCFENNSLRLIEEEKIRDHLSDMCSILSDEKRYSQAVDTAVLFLWDNIYSFYFHYFTSSITCKFGLVNLMKILYNKIFRAPNYLLLLNLISCESHKFSIARALRLKSRI